MESASLWQAFELTLNLHWRGSKNEEGATGAFMATVRVLGPNFPVARVDRKTVADLVGAWRREGQAGATVNRKLAALSKVCKTAFDAGMTPTRPDKFMRLKEGSPRTRVVTLQELQKLLDVSGADFGSLWLLLHDTGLRVSEALNLEWPDVLPDRVVVRESKSGSPRTVPTTTLVRADLEIMRRAGRTQPFPFSQGAVNREWDSARAVMALQGDPEFVPHSLRHTCATNLVTKGVPLAVVQRWLGHKTIAVTMRYAHVGDQQVMDAAKVLE